MPDGKRSYARLPPPSSTEKGAANRFVRRYPPPSSTEKGAANRFIRRYDGPFLVLGHVHGRQDLLQLKHVTTGKQLGAVNIEKNMVVPDGDPCADIRPDTELLQIATPSMQEHNVVQPLSNALSPD